MKLQESVIDCLLCGYFVVVIRLSSALARLNSGSQQVHTELVRKTVSELREPWHSFNVNLYV